MPLFRDIDWSFIVAWAEFQNASTSDSSYGTIAEMGRVRVNDWLEHDVMNLSPAVPAVSVKRVEYI